MQIPEITEVKEHLEFLKKNGLIADWVLPYESILTRRSAAIFFVDLHHNAPADLWMEFEKYDNFSKRLNTEKKISQLEYRVTFNKEEKEKNALQLILA
jgi:hypothetical protein